MNRMARTLFVGVTSKKSSELYIYNGSIAHTGSNSAGYISIGGTNTQYHFNSNKEIPDYHSLIPSPVTAKDL